VNFGIHTIHPNILKIWKRMRYRLHLNDKDWLEFSESVFVFWDNEEEGAYYDYL
jgi:hypothetical protein